MFIEYNYRHAYLQADLFDIWEPSGYIIGNVI